MLRAMDWTLGELSADHIEQALNVLNEALGARSYSAAGLEQEIHDPRTYVLEARAVDGALIGVASARVLAPDGLSIYAQFGEGSRILDGHCVGSLNASAVVPAYRGRGLGSALARARLLWLEAQGCDMVVGLSWLSGLAHTSKPVFERYGFTAVGRSDEIYTRLSIEHDFDCPTCGYPCHCPGLLFVRSLPMTS
jgi:GNAT superfamily N-acetyltransferase